MDKVYVAQCFTGAHCYGVYTSLEAAQQAIEVHAAKLTNYVDIHLHMQWVDTFGNGQQFDWVGKQTQVGDTTAIQVLNKMQTPYIAAVELNAALPFV
jgi:hypothetical protein